MPQTALYVEADYSAQMCADVASGASDLAIFYTPKPHPDLHFETLGEIAYVMVSTEAEDIADVRADTYILAHFAPAFSATHAALLPALSVGAVSSGQNAVVRGLLMAFGGSTYVLRQTALELGRAGSGQSRCGAPGDRAARLCLRASAQPAPRALSPLPQGAARASGGGSALDRAIASRTIEKARITWPDGSRFERGPEPRGGVARRMSGSPRST
jgi:hypothetical protein